MFSEDEQEIIIHEFLNMLSRKETAEYLKDKCSKCQECKFTKQNMGDECASCYRMQGCC